MNEIFIINSVYMYIIFFFFIILFLFPGFISTINMLQVHKGSKGCSLEPHWYIKSEDKKGIIVEEKKK